MRSIETLIKQFFFGFLLISSLGVSFAEEPSPTPSLIAEGASSLDPLEQGIPNFHIVDGAVFRGGRPSEVGIETLETLKVDTIIDLQGGDIHGHDPILDFFNFLVEPGERKGNILREQKLALQDGIQNFYNIPLNSNDSVSPKEAGKIDNILSILHDREDEPVFVHCEHGKDRTGLIVALYEVKYHHMTPEAAHDEMVSLGHKGILDHIFTEKLDKFFWKVAPGYYSQGN